MSAPPMWIVGAGKMAGAMIAGWRRAGVLGDEVLAVRPSGRAVDGVTVVTQIPDEGDPQFILLGVKPQKLDEVAPLLEPRVGPETLLVSILAGVELASLRARFPRAGVIIRAMPNLPVSEGRGVVALVGEQPIVEDAFDLFGPLGLVHAAKDEAEFAAIGALAGAGPAYVARFVAALAKAGEARGLESALAGRIALETVLGTALMAAATGESMGQIAGRVASPNGTTEAGLAVLDKDRALDQLVAATLEAAARRGQELAEAARRG
jgi:pyrroline-5-carboxylate reductase